MKKRNLHRRLIYTQKRNAKRISIYMRLILIIIILYMVVNYSQNKLSPYIIHISEIKTRQVITNIMVEGIKEVFNDNIKHENIVLIKKNDNGKIEALQTNILSLNKITTEVSNAIQKEIVESKEELYIPLGALFSNSIFSSSGPGLKFKIIPVGSVNVKHKTEFIDSGINQTKHKIYLQITVNVEILFPFHKKNLEITNEIIIAETIIIGDVPKHY